MICHDCGGLMYCHRTSNGKKVAQYVCAKYGKQPVGIYCSSGHRIKADAVIEIVRDTLRYLKNTIEDNPEEFIEQTTQKIDIYFNFIGNYSMPEKELPKRRKLRLSA